MAFARIAAAVEKRPVLVPHGPRLKDQRPRVVSSP